MKNYVLTNQIKQDKYTQYLKDFYDLRFENEKTTVIKANLNNVPETFNIGLIYGGSGTGKTTILKDYFKKGIDRSNFRNDIPLISNFDWLSPEKASRLLSSMGFSTVPNWLVPYDKLSNGQQARADLAYVIGRAMPQELVLYDEFTSVVDRNVAKAMSNSLQKYVRRENKKIVLASCHYDIINWLKPDWIYSPENGRLEIAPRLRQPEQFELKIFRARYEAWDLFKHHHYMSEELNKAAFCYIGLINDIPVTFNAVLPFPHGNLKNAFRMSRIVVQPDYQGLGIGSKVTDYISCLYASLGKTMYIKSSNPALWNYWKKSKNWQIVNQSLKEDMIKKNKKLKSQGVKEKLKYFRESTTVSVKWVGNYDHISQNEKNVVLFNADAYKDVAQNQLSMF